MVNTKRLKRRGKRGQEVVVNKRPKSRGRYQKDQKVVVNKAGTKRLKSLEQGRD